MLTDLPLIGFTSCPTDVLGEIAQQMDEDIPTLQCFARLCRATVAVSRTVLFRTCNASIGDKRPIHSFVAVLRGENNIARSIKAVKLASYTKHAYDTPGPSPISLPDIVCLLKALSVVESLTLDGLLWIPSPSSLSIQYRHHSLKQLTLKSVECSSTQESPLELLRLCEHWESVRIKDLEAAQGTTHMQTGPHRVDRLSVMWSAITGDWRLGISRTVDVVTRIKHLVIREVLEEVTGLVQQLVVENERTLEAFTVDLCSMFSSECEKRVHTALVLRTDLDPVRRYKPFFNIGEVVPRCIRMRYFDITVPVSEEYLASSPARPGTVGGHVGVMKLLLQSLPPSVRCVHLHIYAGNCESLPESKAAATALAKWEPLIDTLAVMENVQGIVVSFHYGENNRPCWSARRKRGIYKAHMRNFPIKRGMS